MAEKYALSPEEMKMELNAIEACHTILHPLSFPARGRVLEWLYEWKNAESPGKESY